MENQKSRVVGLFAAQESSQAQEKECCCTDQNGDGQTPGPESPQTEVRPELVGERRKTRVGRFLQRAAPFALKLVLNLVHSQTGIKIEVPSTGPRTESPLGGTNALGRVAARLRDEETPLFI